MDKKYSPQGWIQGARLDLDLCANFVFKHQERISLGFSTEGRLGFITGLGLGMRIGLRLVLSKVLSFRQAFEKVLFFAYTCDSVLDKAYGSGLC